MGNAMNIEDELERDWIKLNEYELSWRAKRDSLEMRDFDQSPWTLEDQNNLSQIVSFMSGAIERIEMRQAVLYRITHANLSTLRGLWRSLLIGALVALAFGVYTKIFG
jgi:hypothetical protein